MAQGGDWGEEVKYFKIMILIVLDPGLKIEIEILSSFKSTSP